MKTLKAIYCAFTLFLAVATVHAQSTWNYVISSPGGGDSLDSLVTWSVTGDLATAPGLTVLRQSNLGPSGLGIAVTAPGIYASTYSAFFSAAIPNPDGSAYQYYPTSVYAPINQYEVNTGPPGFGNQAFGLAASLLPDSNGINLLYVPGTQSVLLPIPFADFNPGTYQSTELTFNPISTLLTVNLTVEPVPEPSSLALAAGAVLSVIFVVGKCHGWKH